MDNGNMQSMVNKGDTSDASVDASTDDFKEVWDGLFAHQEGSDATILDELEREYLKVGEPKTGKLVRLDLNKIDRDPSLQMRARLDEGAVEDYADKFRREKDGVKALRKDEKLFPLVEVFQLPNGRFTVANGWHRVEAMIRAELVSWLFAVQEGDIQAAARYAAGANRTNVSVRVTNADKRQMVTALWAVFPSASSRKVAEMAGVDHHTAERHRPTGLKNQPREGKGGRKYAAPKNVPSKDGRAVKKEVRAVTKEAAITSATPSQATGSDTGGDTTDVITGVASVDIAGALSTGEIPQSDDVHTAANDVLAAEDGELFPNRASVEVRTAGNKRAPATLISMRASVGSNADWQQVAIEGYQLTVRVAAVEGDTATLHFLDGGSVGSVSNR